MSSPIDAEEESRKLRAESQQRRLRLIETQLSVVMTWCSVAATEAEADETENFQQSLTRIKRAVASLKLRIGEPAHVPAELEPEFRQKLESLEVRVKKLEERFPPARPIS